MVYYTHSGLFHCDEVTGFAICKLAGVCETFERLSDIKNLPIDGLISDIGKEHDPSNRRFDHHQSLLLRENGYPLASAGLLWKHFGYNAILNLIGGKETQEHSLFIREIAERVDLTLIQGVDAHDSDNDYKLSANCIGGKVRVYSLPNVVSSFNSKNVMNDEEQTIQFELASAFLQDILKKEIQNAKEYIEGRRKFDALAVVEDDIIILPENLPWKEIVAEKYPTAKYVISPSSHPGNPFSMIAVPIDPNSREVKKPIERPDWFDGFIHQGKWIAGGDSIDILKRLALFNLNEQL